MSMKLDLKHYLLKMRFWLLSTIDINKVQLMLPVLFGPSLLFCGFLQLQKNSLSAFEQTWLCRNFSTESRKWHPFKMLQAALKMPSDDCSSSGWTSSMLCHVKNYSICIWFISSLRRVSADFVLQKFSLENLQNCLFLPFGTDWATALVSVWILHPSKLLKCLQEWAMYFTTAPLQRGKVWGETWR